MSFSEILLVTTLCFYFLSLFLKKEKRYRWLAFFLSLSLVVFAVHTLTEGHRWQMFPAYSCLFTLVMVSLVVFQELFHSEQREMNKTKTLVVYVLLLPLLLLLLAASWIVPISFPE